MEYRVTYRVTHVVLPGIAFGLVAYFAAIALALSGDGNADQIMYTVGGGGGALLVGVALLVVFCLRVHHWRVDATTLAVEESPRVPLFGPRRVARVPFTDIAATFRIESGLDRYFDVLTRGGKRFRLAQAMATPPGGTIGQPVPGANLDAFVAALYDTAARAGTPLPAPREGLSFWNSGPGIAWLVLLLLLCSLFAGAALWALWEGEAGSSARGGQALALVLLLPVGMGWVLWKSVRRRRAVLAEPPRT